VRRRIAAASLSHAAPEFADPRNQLFLGQFSWRDRLDGFGRVNFFPGQFAPVQIKPLIES